MTDRLEKAMTTDEALETIVVAVIAEGPPFGFSPLARAGKVLRDELVRLRALTKPIPCSERLPDSVRFLAFFPDLHGWELYWMSALETKQRTAGSWKPLFTHWQPLPPDPETPNAD